ncbi:hypothetical protein Pogu_0940 [Pyrobaculum oguniense TE7]|uniref:Uncharacterized protein n=1 Tax=Pyrobaculum oguniense (strain DSM 13380 / JCM 10595 / TE7) TaxID=698757 RepID=H6Q8G0_PYROT|nr:hypothetical protein Pogu_0940 [Pyrobaculum oguniense TE7]
MTGSKGLLLALALAVALSAASVYTVDHYVVINYTAWATQVKPTYIFKLGNCDVYVYVARTFNDTTVLLNSPEPVPPRLEPMSEEDVEKVIDALVRLPGETKVGLSILHVFKLKNGDIVGGESSEDLVLNATSLEDLVNKASEKLGIKVYKRPAEADKFMEEVKRKGANTTTTQGLIAKVASIRNIYKRIGDVVLKISYIDRTVYVGATNLTDAVAYVKELERQLGKPLPVYIRVGSYWVSGEKEQALLEAAEQWEKEMKTVRVITEGNRTKAVEGIVHIIHPSAGDLGPVVVVFPYVNGTPPDEGTAKRLVGRFVELAGFCPQPLVVEFWPKTGVEYLVGRANYASYAVPIIALAVAALAALRLKRR